MTSLATLPGFITHFLAGLVLLGGAVFVHVRVTPHDEEGLIRAGNAAAAVALGGTILGFALPLASAIAHSANLLDAAVWGDRRAARPARRLVRGGAFPRLGARLGDG